MNASPSLFMITIMIMMTVYEVHDEGLCDAPIVPSCISYKARDRILLRAREWL